MDQFIGTLNFGTKQKVSVISALLHNPRVLILDESMNGLDAKSARIFREFLVEFKKRGEKHNFFNPHTPPGRNDLRQNRRYLPGKVVAEGSVEELKGRAHEESLEEVFLKLTESKEEVFEIIQALKL